MLGIEYPATWKLARTTATQAPAALHPYHLLWSRTGLGSRRPSDGPLERLCFNIMVDSSIACCTCWLHDRRSLEHDLGRCEIVKLDLEEALSRASASSLAVSPSKPSSPRCNGTGTSGVRQWLEHGWYSDVGSKRWKPATAATFEAEVMHTPHQLGTSALFSTPFLTSLLPIQHHDSKCMDFNLCR